jgi:uncharacterized protein (TIGR01244 family)
MRLRINAVSAAIAALLISLALAADPAAVTIEKQNISGIRNFSIMDDSRGVAGSPVGFGGATDASAMASLSEQGFATVINLRKADEEGVDVPASRAAAQEAGLTYVHLPVDPKNLAPGVIDEVLATVGDENRQPVYLHCNSATRAGAVWMISRVLGDGWSIEAAGREVEKIAADPNDAVAFATAYLAQ